MKNSDLKGKNALLTGGSKGLGPHIGRALASEGVNVALTARTESALNTVAEELASYGVRTLPVAADVTDEQSRLDLLERVTAEFGQIDILVNNAGMEMLCRYHRLTPEYIQTMIRTNLEAPMLLARLVLPDMLARKSGHIVTMASLGGKKGSPYTATYAATKAGLIEWAQGLREELRQSGVSVSAICPGFVAEAGMFAVYNKTAPRLAGATTPEKVAQAVVRAIKDDVGEIIVNPSPIKPMQIVDAIHPGIIRWVFRTFGLYDFYRQQADENERQFFA